MFDVIFRGIKIKLKPRLLNEDWLVGRKNSIGRKVRTKGGPSDER